MNSVSISVFFPCYNDAGSIGALVRSAVSVVSSITDDWEIIVVNDGSTDRSAEILEKMQRTTPRLRIITHKKNLGYGAAIRSGIGASRKKFIFYTDGDGQYDPTELKVLLSLMSDRTDFVNGVKMFRSDAPHRIIIGAIYGRFVQYIFRLPISDVDCDFRLMRSSVVKQLSLKSFGGAICVELILKAMLSGARFRQAPIHHFARRHGHSEFFRVGRVITTLIEVGALWVKYKFQNVR